jgi:hypothetical protein
LTVDQDMVISGTVGPVCHCCGKPVPEGNLAWDYPVPDPAGFLSGEELAERVAFRSQRVMSIRGLGNFISVILPVPVEHDREATLGLWLNIPELQEWNRVMDAGRQGGDSWAGLRFVGRIATAAQPWPQIFGAWAQALVPGPDQAPRLVHSHDPLLAEVLITTWPEEMIRSGRNRHAPRDRADGTTPNPYAH